MPSDATMQTPSTILVVDERELRRAALTAFIAPWADTMDARVVGVTSIEDADPQIFQATRLVVVNLGGAGCSDAAARETIRAVRTATSGLGLAVLADSCRTEDMVAAFEIGADGYLPTSTEPRIALQALGFIAAGGQFFPPTALVAVSAGRGGERSEAARNDALTTRQREVLKLLREGKPNKVIARELDMQEATVKVHVRQIMRKLGVSNRTQAALASTPDQELAAPDERASDADHDAALAGERLPYDPDGSTPAPLQCELEPAVEPALAAPARSF